METAPFFLQQSEFAEIPQEWVIEMKRRPVIGVMPLIDYEKHSYWMLPGYMKGLQEAGAFPVMLPIVDSVSAAENAVRICNGILFTGGQDVDPAVYLKKKTPLCGETSPERDLMERLILEQAMIADKPVLGICRGIQFINAALGGTLWQDIPTQKPSEVVHSQNPPYNIPSHNVTICADAPLRTLIRQEIISVNSYHHQGIRELSPILEPMAYAPDGLVEAVYSPKHYFLWAVQWHPELSYTTDENSRKILRAFVDRC